MNNKTESTPLGRKVLMLIAFAFLAFVVTECKADQHQGFYLSIGIGVHDTSIDGPEIDLGSSLGLVEFGYQYKNLEIKYMHISGIRDREVGFGLNAVFAAARWEF